jgi:aquaporin Z
MRAVGLICSQLLGAVLAGLLLRVFPFREDVFTVTRLGTPHLNLTAFAVSGISMATLVKGIAIEGALTFLLMFAAIAVTLDPRASRWLGSWASRTPALWLGLILVALTIVGFPLTGAALNPARWLGPVIAEFTVEPLQMQKPFADNPIYWIGPTAGALLAGWVYNALVLTPEEEDAVPGVMLPGGTPTLASARVRK